MQSSHAHRQYTTTQFAALDRGKLLLMMYEGAINFLKHAKLGMEAKDYVKLAKYLNKAQAVIAELANTLDFQAGGQVAKDLSRLYEFMLFYLTEANIEKNPQKIQRVIRLIERVSSAYHEVISRPDFVLPEKTNASTGPQISTSAQRPQQNKPAPISSMAEGQTIRVAL